MRPGILDGVFGERGIHVPDGGGERVLDREPQRWLGHAREMGARGQDQKDHSDESHGGLPLRVTIRGGNQLGPSLTGCQEARRRLLDVPQSIILEQADLQTAYTLDEAAELAVAATRATGGA